MKRLAIATVCLSFGAGGGFIGAARAEVTHEFRVSDCEPGTCLLVVDRPGWVHNEFSIVIDRAMTAREKRDEIARVLGRTFRVVRVGEDRFQVFSATDETEVTLNTDATEETDRITSDIADSGMIRFDGHFDPFTAPSQPAIFTAGMVTDVGELIAQVSSQEINFQTDGPIICQALYQRLAPQALQYGAQVNYAGDRLEVYFDPAYAVTQGGVVFGTTSPTPGCSGTVHSMPETGPACPGDVNRDGTVDLIDLTMMLASFGLGASDEGFDCDADLNSDGGVDLADLALVLSTFGRPCR